MSTPDPDPRTPPVTSDALRHRMTRGEGDKVNFPDPAASPLGTDAEAGGTSPSPREIADAARAELTPHALRRPSSSGVKSSEAGRPIAGESGTAGGRPFVGIGIGFGVLVAVLIVVLLLSS